AYAISNIDVVLSCYSLPASLPKPVLGSSRPDFWRSPLGAWYQPMRRLVFSGSFSKPSLCDTQYHNLRLKVQKSTFYVFSALTMEGRDMPVQIRPVLNAGPRRRSRTRVIVRGLCVSLPRKRCRS